MTKKEFESKCRDLELNGWTIYTYEPGLKFAIYRKNGQSRQVGSKK